MKRLDQSYIEFKENLHLYKQEKYFRKASEEELKVRAMMGNGLAWAELMNRVFFKR